MLSRLIVQSAMISAEPRCTPHLAPTLRQARVGPRLEDRCNAHLRSILALIISALLDVANTHLLIFLSSNHVNHVILSKTDCGCSALSSACLRNKKTPPAVTPPATLLPRANCASIANLADRVVAALRAALHRVAWVAHRATTTRAAL